MRPLIIFGGNGFLGQALCQVALKNDIPVISISRSGRPNHIAPWLDHPKMTWITADVFVDTHWQTYLQDSIAVINLIGLKYEQKEKGITFQRFHVEANRKIIKSLLKNPNILYIYLSARGNGPLLAKEYIITKRIAERETEEFNLKGYIIRPGLVIGKERPLSLFEGTMIRLLVHIPFLKESFEPVYPVKLAFLADEIFTLTQMELPQQMIIKEY